MLSIFIMEGFVKILVDCFSIFDDKILVSFVLYFNLNVGKCIFFGNFLLLYWFNIKLWLFCFNILI